MQQNTLSINLPDVSSASGSRVPHSESAARYDQQAPGNGPAGHVPTPEQVILSSLEKLEEWQRSDFVMFCTGWFSLEAKNGRKRPKDRDFFVAAERYLSRPR